MRAGKAWHVYLEAGISKINLLEVKMKGYDQHGGWQSLRRPRSEGDFEDSDLRKKMMLFYGD